jgi:cyclopropane-fatty-acyl-phospholipid synthase
MRFQFATAAVIVAIHLLAVVSLFHISMPGLLAFGVLYFATLCVGITFGYHRMLTHHSFESHPAIQWCSLLLGALALQGGPLRWVADHRKHHGHADRPGDPHRPGDGILWSHVLWMFWDTDEQHTFLETAAAGSLQRIAAIVERSFVFINVLVPSLTFAVLYLILELPTAISIFLWAFPARLVAVWHATWLVNSATHLWGYRRYATRDESRNNVLVALATFGEGWHNNHHYDPRSARHGHSVIEIDVTYGVIRALQRLRLVWNVHEHQGPKEPAMGIYSSFAREAVQKRLCEADIEIDGSRPWDIRVSDERFFSSVLSDGSLGAGESYMKGWWDCDQLDEMAVRVLNQEAACPSGNRLTRLAATARVLLFDLQKGIGSRRVAKVHYDLPVPLFEAMLGPTMNYSCGYWRTANDLTTAQQDKMKLICSKVGLQPGMRVLDIGCGWGGLARHVAQEHACEVVGITISEKQQEYAAKACAGLPVVIHARDYRDASPESLGTFDAITSVGMIEHVGPKNYARFFAQVARLLRPTGLALVQTFGREQSQPTDPWINQYIFPNSYVPSMCELNQGMKGLFVMEDWHNFGADYDRTLLAWASNFELWAEANWKQTDPRLYRMWRYYLLTFAAGFRVRNRAQLWQAVLSPAGVPGGYRSIR